MRLSKPHTYQITWRREETPKVVKSDNDKLHFSNPVTLESTPKLYVISDRGKPIYVGKTTGPIAARLSEGFKPAGHNGYKGYLWRHYLKKATINIWILTLDGRDTAELEEDPIMKLAIKGDNKKRTKKRIEEIIIETLEAEIVLLIQRKWGQWPEYQSEIHFHQSQDTHRDAARKIVNHYRSA